MRRVGEGEGGGGVRERPIIMSAESVRAILAGTKTMTRRVVKPQPDPGFPFFRFVLGTEKNASLWLGYASAGSLAYTVRCPYGVPGDRLWVRETWGLAASMPRWASRLTLEVTAVRVERLQEITTDDLAAEGFRGTIGYGPMWFETWREAWDSDNAKRGFGWESNPWVWVVGFKQVKEAGE